MKYSTGILSIVGLLAISQLVHSDAITDTYSTGDTLTATTMNNIKSAVNDNDARITALETAPKANLAATAPTPLDDVRRAVGHAEPGEDSPATPLEVTGELRTSLAELTEDGLGGYWLWVVAGEAASKSAHEALRLAEQLGVL